MPWRATASALRCRSACEAASHSGKPDPPTQPGVEPLRAQPGAASAGRPHVVAVDDVAVRELLRDYLDQSGFRVTAVPDGAGMREVLAADAVDLLVLGDKPGSDDGLTPARRVHGISGPPGRRCARV